MPGDGAGEIETERERDKKTERERERASNFASKVGFELGVLGGVAVVRKALH